MLSHSLSVSQHLGYLPVTSPSGILHLSLSPFLVLYFLSCICIHNHSFNGIQHSNGIVYLIFRELVCACSLYFVPLCRAVLCYVVLFQDHGSRMSSDACVRGSNPFGALVLDTKSRLCAKAQLGNSATPHGSLGVVQVVHPTSAFARPLHGSSDLETHIDSASHSRFLASTLATTKHRALRS